VEWRCCCGAFTWSRAASFARSAELRHLLSTALGNRFTAFAAGLGLTAVLQSSTATGLMTASFAGEGLVALVPALAIMLGANVGTTLIVQVLSFNVAAVARCSSSSDWSDSASAREAGSRVSDGCRSGLA
jgi:hypothetical protein